ncbi:hypothetical protein EW145_g418 [Phellinidium pouzarii]|uniref:SAGA-associated factor 11 n=1 Tax=Phellinidium pouzarii TaxID=167371 RepID=A0A4S4LK82_9AGAM|nr:hypothetical protein EW145_g418 [Phellinidium pouzarii]
MTRADKDAALADLSSRILSEMLGEIVMDTTLQAYKEERRSSSICRVCNTRCGQVHAHSATAPVPGSSRAASPPPINADGFSLTGASTPGGSNKTDGNVNLDCVNCQRPVASNRYAQHLATCLGVGIGVRRGAQRNAVTKTKSSANGRSTSPYVDEVMDESRTAKGKIRAKAKSAGSLDDDPNGGQKRPRTPQPSPLKKQKKGKGPPSSVPVPTTVSGTGPPRLGRRLAPPGSNPRPSSRLRGTPTPSVASLVSKNSRSRSPSAQTDSSDAEVDSAVEAGSHSSVIGALSPSLPAAESIGRGQVKGRSKAGSLSNGSVTGNAKAKKVTGTGPPVKKPPPPPPTPVQRLPSPKTLLPPAPIRRPESNYLIDIEGDETGSDTD